MTVCSFFVPMRPFSQYQIVEVCNENIRTGINEV